MKFKNLYSDTAIFEFKGSVYDCVDSFFETNDAEMIEYLKQNTSFMIIDEPKKGK